jgi:GNAT superfamily N-acetyltransferase
VGAADADHARGVRPQRPGQPLTSLPIRAARVGDVERLRSVEVAAGAVFADIGMPEIAADHPPSAEVLAGWIAAGRVWVACDGDLPVAYVLVDDVDGCVHVEQLSVHPDWSRRGVGAALLDHVTGWASSRGAAALTLTTFADVPWNAPYYERLGFVRLDSLTPGLRAVRDSEAARGLDRWPRVAMRRDL